MTAPTAALAALITTLVALGPLSTDFYLPALPAITTALDTDVASTQLTLSVFLVGLGAGQLVYGPLSDRFGRRPVLLFGLVVYLLSSIACAFAATIETLIAARFLQSLGACAGPVLGRAIVRDVYGPHDSARMLSYIGAAMALAPLIGPVFGGALTVWFGWRATFVFLTVFSFAQTVLVWRMLDETNAHRDAAALRPGRIVGNFRTLLVDPLYRGVLLCNSFSYSGLFAFISGSPFVFINLFGFSPQAMGLAFGFMVSGYIAGTTLSGRLSRRLGAPRLLAAGAVLGAVAGITMLGLTVAGPHHPATVMAPMWFSAFALGMVMPNAMAIGMGPYPKIAGSAASLMGFTQMGLAALVGVLVGHSLNSSAVPMAVAIASAGLACLASYLMWVRPVLRAADQPAP
ncbi:MAG: multidrug effflux MFS transporter [Rhodocyclaceae bacterium]|nr:multidrug effflux MFS transporter [Rhodocyclaceae bacterium]